jgi:hypothetical protein
VTHHGVHGREASTCAISMPAEPTGLGSVGEPPASS